MNVNHKVYEENHKQQIYREQKKSMIQKDSNVQYELFSVLFFNAHICMYLFCE